MGFIKVIPFGCKFGIFVQERHEIAGKGLGTSCCFRAHNPVNGDFNQSQIAFPHGFQKGKTLIQDFQIRIFSFCQSLAVGLLGQFSRLLVFRHIHDSSPFYPVFVLFPVLFLRTAGYAGVPHWTIRGRPEEGNSKQTVRCRPKEWGGFLLSFRCRPSRCSRK